MLHGDNVSHYGGAAQIIQAAAGSAGAGGHKSAFQFMLQSNGRLLTQRNQPKCCLQLIADGGLQKGVQHLVGFKLHVGSNSPDGNAIGARLW